MDQRSQPAGCFPKKSSLVLDLVDVLLAMHLLMGGNHFMLVHRLSILQHLLFGLSKVLSHLLSNFNEFCLVCCQDEFD